MMVRIFKSEMARLHREESGVALMLTLSVFLFLYVVCSAVYSIGETVRQKVELQNACDSAAYSAAMVQADGLSRMAMVNRAMSWTYVQLTNMQIDYITYRWLECVVRRFEQDSAACQQYNGGTSFGGFGFLTSRCSANNNLRQRGIGWFCGVAGKGVDMVRLNNRSDPVPVTLIRQTLQNMSQVAQYGAYIDGMTNQIVAYNQALRGISIKMHQSMAQIVSGVLAQNLPRDKNGEIDKQIASDFLFYQAVPFPMTENASSPYDIESVDYNDNGIPTPYGLGYFSPLLNNERDERIFLTMADGEVHDTLPEYFGGSGSDERVAGGLDQWFIRTYSDEVLQNNERIINPMKSLEDMRRSYMDFGICRGYKNANRMGANQMTYRDHHRSLENDTPPSCLNTHDNNPEQCHAVPNSVGLVAEYEWSSGRYNLQCYHIHKIGRNPHVSHIHHYNISFLNNCTAGHNCLIGNGSHARNEYRSCTASGKNLRIPFTSINWPPIPILPLPCSGGYNLPSIGSYTLPTTERNWVLTEWIARFSNVLKPNGFARIYGDDIGLVDGRYAGTPAQPWVLNSTFYGKDGAIIVGLARKQRNPWAILLNGLADVVSSDRTDEDGIYSAFNPVKGGYLVAFSAARAAHRFVASDSAESWVARNSGHGDVPPLIAWGDGEYETRYDAVCDDQSAKNPKWGDKVGRFTIAQDNETLKALRVGCVCNDKQNTSRFARCWNLCVTDWSATLLPLRYAWAEPRGEWYDSFAHDLADGRRIGNITWEDVGRDAEYDLDPIEYAASSMEAWCRFYDALGDQVSVDEEGKVKEEFRVDDNFLQMKAPMNPRITRARRVSAPYDTMTIYDADPGDEVGRADVSQLYKIRIL